MIFMRHFVLVILEFFYRIDYLFIFIIYIIFAIDILYTNNIVLWNIFKVELNLIKLKLLDYCINYKII